MAKERFDEKGRKLKTGESQRKSDGRYRYTYVDNDGKTCDVYSWTLTHNDRTPAGRKPDLSLREKEAEVKKKLIEGLNAGKGNMTVLELSKLYVQNKSKDVKETTKSVYRTNLKTLESHAFGKKKICDVSSMDAQAFLDNLHEKHGKGYSSIANIRGMLRPAFAEAKRNRWISFNPFDFPLLKKRYGGSKTRDALTRRDMRRFLDFVRTDKNFRKYFDGMYILFNTGLRISEFCGLTIDDIDFNEHVIHVNKQLIRIHTGDKNTYYIEDGTKTDAGMRDVPMADDVEECFRNAIQNRPVLKKEPVVSTQDGTRKVSGFIWFDKDNHIEVAQHWENHFRWALNRFNSIYKDEIECCTPHVARHTFCSNMASLGMAPKTLQTIMGHSSIGVTMDVYTHVEARDVQKDFRELMNNKQYSVYTLDREPDVVVFSDDEDD